jgi:two-component system, NarL family, nitrate/nitrite response regulator NarL
MISAVVCDNHLLFGDSFAAALRAEGARARVAACPEEAVATLETAAADRVVMSVLFPEERGLHAMRHIRDRWPQTHVCGVGRDGDLPWAAVNAGAHVVVSKKRPLGELVETVLAGSRTPWPGTPSQRPQAYSRDQSGAPNRADHSLAARFLTNREREVLHLLVSARSTQGIAGELGISVTTARGYVQSILAKLGVHSRVEAVAYAVRHAVVVC